MIERKRQLSGLMLRFGLTATAGAFSATSGVWDSLTAHSDVNFNSFITGSLFTLGKERRRISLRLIGRFPLKTIDSHLATHIRSMS